MEKTTSVSELKGVGPKTKELLHNMGVYTIGDILLHFPRDYVKYPKMVCLSEATSGTTQAICIHIKSNPVVRKGRGMAITFLRETEDDVSLEAIWFRMPYIASSLKKNSTVILYGKVSDKNGKLHMEQPAIFAPSDYAEMEEQLHPIYSLTKGINNKFLRKAIRSALDICDTDFEYLPLDIRKKYELSEYNYALEKIHFPSSMEELIFARKRMVFDEFFLFLLTMQMQKIGETRQNNTYRFPLDFTDTYMSQLPYELTGAQKKTIIDVQTDMKGEYLMQRLIQGDVGSGKTIVAFLSMLLASDNGYQSAIMAPTEVLAAQHAESFVELCQILQIEKEVVLITGSMTAKEKRAAYEKIKEGTGTLIVGTHALIQEAVEYNRLALVITDEQHRFGVKQRESLAKKGFYPHVIVMSATPIPRTLAIILYGDMDISVMNEMPKHRLPIKNCVVGENYRPKANSFLLKEVMEGHQAYVVCPLVEESEQMEGKNVLDVTEALKEALPESVRISFLHGKMKSSEKNQIMDDFKNKKIDILVSTTVIEVGVNVPNATVMMIENADRFGLAQLHQLRGRVGRGKDQSYCIMMNSSDTDIAAKRLDILNKSNDGFYIASEDLKLRGPGDFFGIRQSGVMNFLIADVYNDANVLMQASDEVKRIMEIDANLELEEHVGLHKKMKEVFSKEDLNLNL